MKTEARLLLEKKINDEIAVFDRNKENVLQDNIELFEDQGLNPDEIILSALELTEEWYDENIEKLNDSLEERNLHVIEIDNEEIEIIEYGLNPADYDAYSDVDVQMITQFIESLRGV